MTIGSMIAAVYHGRGDIRFQPMPIPTPAAGELLLKVGTVGVCGSDVGEWAHGPHQHPIVEVHPATGHLGPIVPGHEFSGTVVAVGEGVDSAWVGQEVASCGSIACGTCAVCLRGQSNQCLLYSGVGLHSNGALAEFVATPVKNCLPIDGLGISLDEAALCQPMAIAVHNVARAGDVVGQTVLVQGAGGIGAFLIYALAEAGARVIAADMDSERLSIATDQGASKTVLVSGESRDSGLIQAAVGESELRAIFEVSGSASGLRSALSLAPKGCRIVLVGIQKAPIEIDLAAVTLKELILIGTNALVMETDFPVAVDLIARRAGRWGRIAPRVVPMVDGLIDEALLPMSEGRSRAIKTLIDPIGSADRVLRSLSTSDE